MLYFRAGYGTSFLEWFFGADFWYVCHRYKCTSLRHACSNSALLLLLHDNWQTPCNTLGYTPLHNTTGIRTQPQWLRLKRLIAHAKLLVSNIKLCWYHAVSNGATAWQYTLYNWRQETLWLVCNQQLMNIMPIRTRSSAIADRPCDALCHSIFC